MNADAINLRGKQDRNAEFLEVASSGDDGSASPALPEQDQAGVGSFVGIKFSTPICVECMADQLQCEGAMVIGDGFGIYAWCLAEFDDELANAAMRVVPPIVSTEEADDES